ncbi:MAG TPA: polysaccharide deacetylase family protein [Chitinophagaceae bacterium]|nr:polysaccharide deacetylase family protein [Chitinophagaceae bacterium]
MKYFIKTPWWLKKLYSSYTWDIKTKEKIIYLSFDDGPHAIATGFVLDQLKKYNARATFFCIGKNVLAEPGIYRRVIDEGHSVGNHTQHHLNGWKAKDTEYLADVTEAAQLIDSSLFRPPYGRITSFQAKNIHKAMKKENSRIVMWDVLSGDFDEKLSGDDCLKNVILNAKNGSIVVFHDSEKAFPRLEYCLPIILEFFEKKGVRFEKIPNY